MKLELKNVGKIKYADIKLNGITIIAGENNTGKSTVGKMLFCLFHSFYKIEEQIREERRKTIERLIRNYYFESSNLFPRNLNQRKIAKYIVEKKEEFLSNTEKLQKELENFYYGVDSHFYKHLNTDSFEQLAEKISNSLKVEDAEIRKIILRRRFDAEFGMKVGHLNSLDDETKIKLDIKNGSIICHVVKNEEIKIDSYISLIKEIIYIDDPFVLDDLSKRELLGIYNIFEHRSDLLNKIAILEKKKDFSAVDELIIKQKLGKIFSTMKNICDGELIKDERGSFVYKTDTLNDSLEKINLSTGMKSFVILKSLLQNGSVDENGVIILDEPEIHLHPEWQLKFAEIIVLLQKEFRMNILINTHSPYFLNAIEVYSEKYAIEDKCNYYFTDEKDRRTNIIDVTNNRELIYEKLAKPLQDLENLEYQNENTISEYRNF